MCTYIILSVFLRPYIILPVFFTAICSKLMGFLLLVARSGVYIRFPYSADTPVPWFDPFLELATTVYLGYLLFLYPHSLICDNFPHNGCYFKIYVIGRSCSLDISLTRNQTLFSVWLHVRAYITIGILSRYLIPYYKYHSIYWDGFIFIFHWCQWVSNILPLSIISAL